MSLTQIREMAYNSPAMKIERIRLKNFKMFRDVVIDDIPPLAVFVGANGSGKSTLFDTFGFLRDSLTRNVQVALDKRGGFGEVRTRDGDGAIEIELKFRMKIAERERLVTYGMHVGRGDNGAALIEREFLRYKRMEYGAPFHFLDFKRGKGKAVTNEQDFSVADADLNREEQSLDPNTPAIKGLGQFERFKAANAFRQFIENWHLSDFHINAARSSPDAMGYAEHLSEVGDNLALVAQFMAERHPEAFSAVLKKMERRVPGVSEVKAESMRDGRVLLQFRDKAWKDPFAARYASDGTVKMFAYLVLLNDPSRHPLLCVEEPENQLYPSLLGELLEEFRLYARMGEGQVFVSTHSPDLLDETEADEVFWLAKKGRRFRGLSRPGKRDDQGHDGRRRQTRAHLADRAV